MSINRLKSCQRFYAVYLCLSIATAVAAMLVYGASHTYTITDFSLLGIGKSASSYIMTVSESIKQGSTLILMLLVANLANTK